MRCRIAMLFGAALMLGSCNSVGGNGANNEGTRSLVSAFGNLGYDAVALPSTAYGPGSLVTSVKGHGFEPPLRLTYLCRPDFASSPPAIVDAAASTDVSSALSGNFNLGLSTLAQLGVGANASYVRSLTLKLNNVKVEQLAYDDLYAIRSHLGPVCADLVKEFRDKGIAYQTKEAIRADATYTIEFRQGVSANVKGLVIEAITAAFGGSFERGSGLTVTGNGLFYALVLVKV